MHRGSRSTRDDARRFGFEQGAREAARARSDLHHGLSGNIARSPDDAPAEVEIEEENVGRAAVSRESRSGR